MSQTGDVIAIAIDVIQCAQCCRQSLTRGRLEASEANFRKVKHKWEIYSISEKWEIYSLKLQKWEIYSITQKN